MSEPWLSSQPWQKPTDDEDDGEDNHSVGYSTSGKGALSELGSQEDDYDEIDPRSQFVSPIDQYSSICNMNGRIGVYTKEVFRNFLRFLFALKLYKFLSNLIFFVSQTRKEQQL